MRNVLVHAHIFKNAGTTFDYSLKRSFGEGFVDHRDDRAFLDGRNAYLLEYLHANPVARALSSHSLHFRITGSDDLAVFPVYFLRHPLARVWSVYNFEKQQTGVNTEGARRAKEMDLNSYVDWYMEETSPATIRNIHAIFLSGTGPSPDHMADKFAGASEYLASGECQFALVERYDDSMVVLEQTLAPDFPELDLAYVRKNVSADDPGAAAEERADALLSALDDNVREKLLKANDYDLRLYRQAASQLDHKLAGLADLESRQEAFRLRCRELQAGQG